MAITIIIIVVFVRCRPGDEPQPDCESELDEDLVLHMFAGSVPRPIGAHQHVRVSPFSLSQCFAFVEIFRRFSFRELILSSSSLSFSPPAVSTSRITGSAAVKLIVVLSVKLATIGIRTFPVDTAAGLWNALPDNVVIR